MPGSLGKLLLRPTFLESQLSNSHAEALLERLHAGRKAEGKLIGLETMSIAWTKGTSGGFCVAFAKSWGCACRPFGVC